MVPRERIETVERTLLDRGWKTPVQDDYDDRYYREWSHEIPPLMHPTARRRSMFITRSRR